MLLPCANAESVGRNGTADPANFIAALKQTGGDGLDMDTMEETPRVWRDAGITADDAMAFQPEGGGSVATLNWETFSVCHCTYDKLVQTVDHFKWLEPRRCTSVRDRWSQDHTDAFHFAFFNAVGFESTESNWGTWNGLNPHDSEALRRIFTVLRYMGRTAQLVLSPHWEPHITGVTNANASVFASFFPRMPLGNPRQQDDGEAVWLLVNRANISHPKGPQLTIDGTGGTLYDCWRGVPIEGSDRVSHTRVGRAGAQAQATTLRFAIEARGYGCVLRTSNSSAPGTPLGMFLARMQSLHQKGPLAGYSSTYTYLQQTMTPHPRTALATDTLKGMTLLPRADAFDLRVNGIEDQAMSKFGGDVQYYWEDQPTQQHATMRIPIEAFLLDTTPVTNAQYDAYLQRTGYRPTDPHNWLLNRNGSRTSPPAMRSIPVTYVSLAEARLYCRSEGKRLPQEWEFQYAAQGPAGARPYPWGSNNCTSCVPDKVIGRRLPGAAEVGSHPAGNSLEFGVADLVGNVWQYTNEVKDEHSRSSILRGGANWAPGMRGVAGSHWYFPQTPLLTQHNKYYLMSDSYERAGTLGFRCAMDVAPSLHAQTHAPTPADGSQPTGNTGGIKARWGGPPRAYTVLSSQDSPAEWVHWSWQQDTHTLQTARGSTHVSTATGTGSSSRYAIGDLRPAACPSGLPGTFSQGSSGVVAFSWAPGTNTTKGAVASSCGFELTVAVNGTQTVALYGGTPNLSLNVTALVSNDTGGGPMTISQSVSPLPGQVHMVAATVADSVHHVTVVGAAPGSTLTLLWQLNATQAPPQNSTAFAGTYTTLSSTRCGDGHGAVNIDKTAVVAGTADKCREMCSADASCSCAQFKVSTGECWRRSTCIPSLCSTASVDLEVFVKDYTPHPGVNCAGAAGAWGRCIPSECNTKVATNVTAQRCTEFCEMDASCTGAEYSASKQWCWKRAVVDVSKCKHTGGGAFVLLSRASTAAAQETFNPLLYAAQLFDGVAPPLPGYEETPLPLPGYKETPL